MVSCPNNGTLTDRGGWCLSVRFLVSGSWWCVGRGFVIFAWTMTDWGIVKDGFLPGPSLLLFWMVLFCPAVCFFSPASPSSVYACLPTRLHPCNLLIKHIVGFCHSLWCSDCLVCGVRFVQLWCKWEWVSSVQQSLWGERVPAVTLAKQGQPHSLWETHRRTCLKSVGTESVSIECVFSVYEGQSSGSG